MLHDTNVDRTARTTLDFDPRRSAVRSRMAPRNHAWLAIGAIVLGASVAHAQSFNVDFGQPADAPSSTYAAAGLPGVWNSIRAEDTPMTIYHLVGLDGAPTSVTLYNIGGTSLLSATDPTVTGDDARLMNDALLTHSSTLEVCLFVDGLTPGTYEIIMYAWMPNAPAVRSRVRHDLVPTTTDVGGAWPGSHVEGITYARNILVIPSDGALRSHSGIVPGMSALAGAALNGVQIRLLCSTASCPDGSVPPHDAGPAADAAPMTDAAFDSGAPPVDSGMTAHDAGVPLPDAGSPIMDSGRGGTMNQGCGCRAASARTPYAHVVGVVVAWLTMLGARRRRVRSNR
jgi:hypothetical protein